MIEYVPGEVLVTMPALQGLVWPAIPVAQKAQVAALLAQLQQSEFMPADQLRALQEMQLSNLLLHARRSTPHYADLPAMPNHRFDADVWRTVPLLTRTMLQSDPAAIVAREMPPGHGRTGEIVTSGSTGFPVRVLQTEVTQSLWLAFTLRDILWARRDPGQRLGAIRYLHKGDAPYPAGKTGKGWGAVSGIVGPVGESCTLNIKTPLAQQVEWLQRMRPAYLVTFPSNLHYLAEYCRDEGVRIEGLRGVSTLSEVLRPATRRLAREVLGVPVQDMYSAQEVGYMALQCPEHEHYHVCSEGVFLEVLDDDGAPCAPGQVGRIVVTSLHNFASPLIRYDIGDHAEVGDPCPCGRGLPVLKRILGRTRNSLQTPDGERIWTQFGTMEIVERLPVRAVQLVQERLDRVVLRLAVKQPLTDAEQQTALDILRGHLPYPFEMGLEQVDELPRSKSGKFEDLVSLVDRGVLVS